MASIQIASGFVEELAANINAPVDLVKTMLLMLSTVLLAPLFRIMKDPIVRQIFSLGVGLLFVAYLHK